MPHDLGTFAVYAIEHWIVAACTRPTPRAHEREKVRDFDTEPDLQTGDDVGLIPDGPAQQPLTDARRSLMTDRERDAIYQTALRQLAAQRIANSPPLVKSVLVIAVRSRGSSGRSS